MRRVVIVLPGIAGVEIDELDGATALQTARTPTLDAMSRTGKVGRVRLQPGYGRQQGLVSGAGAAFNTLLGGEWPVGPEPMKASLLKKLLAPPPEVSVLPLPTDGQVMARAAGLSVDAEDVVWRVDLIAASADLEAPLVQSHMPEGLTRAEAVSLLDAWGAALRSSDDTSLHGFDCRAMSQPNGCADPASVHVLVQRGVHREAERTVCFGADQLGGRAWHAHPPEGPLADVLIGAMELSQRVFESHPVNRTRAELGLAPVSVAWISGHDAFGGAAGGASLSERMGVSAVLATTDQVAAAVGGLHGLAVLPLPTSSETIFAADRLKTLSDATIDALDHFELVVVHDSGALRPALAGDAHGLIEAIESIDQKLLMPIRDALLLRGEADGEPNYRLLVTTDRVVDVVSRDVLSGDVPLVMGGAYVRTMVERSFCESDAMESDLSIEDGPSFLEYALHSGVSRARARVRGVTSHRAE